MMAKKIETIEDSIVENRKKILLIDSKLTITTGSLEDKKIQYKKTKEDLEFLANQLSVTN